MMAGAAIVATTSPTSLAVVKRGLPADLIMTHCIYRPLCPVQALFR
jgi:hypothetical protein